jgi:uncharacterized protein YkwD
MIAKGIPASLLALLIAGCAHSPDLSKRDSALDQAMTVQGFDHALLSRAIFRQTNAVRVANGAPLLEALPELDDAADMQATYLALNLTVGHHSMFPHEHDVGQRVVRTGLVPSSVGENTIMMPARRPPEGPQGDYTYREYAAFLVEGWMNSPDHRETMLLHKFTGLGCAARIANGFGTRNERVFATQVFFRAAAPVAVEPDATSIQWFLKHLAVVGPGR